MHHPCCDISVQRGEEKTTYLLAHRVKKGVLRLIPHHFRINMFVDAVPMRTFVLRKTNKQIITFPCVALRKNAVILDDRCGGDAFF